MEILFLISWIFGLIFCLICTVIAWKTKDKEMWGSLGFMWIGVILTGWVTGFAILMLMIYVVFIKLRFEKK